MDGRPVLRVDLPEWLSQRIAESSSVWGVPTDHVEKKIAEAGARVGDPIQRNPGTDNPVQLPTPGLERTDTTEPTNPASIQPSNKGSPKEIDADNEISTERATTHTPTSFGAASPAQSSEIQLKQYTPMEPPAWYNKISTTSLAMKELNKRPSPTQSQYLKGLSSMKGCMDRCEAGANEFDELRNHIHKAEAQLRVDKYIVRKTRMLEEAYGLPRIFASSKIEIPWDLKADAWQLYLRWYHEIFEVDLLRGIKTRKGRDRNADSIDPSWKKIDSKYNGEGDLVLGQWWPTQLCLVRDGAHGAAQGGIFGEKGKGAYSVVLSGGGYHDQDDGDIIWYSGTDGKAFMPTENTLRLIESCDTVREPVRVFRSHMLPKKNKYRPAVGLRYDGLYLVQAKELKDKEKQIFSFLLVRHRGQHPIRYGDNAAARPTMYEIEEDMKMRKQGR